MTFKNKDDLLSAVKYFSSLPQGGYTQQLYHCKATIICPDFSDFAILKSYSTLVAAFQYSTGILWTFGFYSNTTAQHIAKFRNLLRYKYPYKSWDFPRRVNLYNDSRTPKYMGRIREADDFASVIESAINQH